MVHALDRQSTLTRLGTVSGYSDFVISGVQNERIAWKGLAYAWF
jgi:hypothetical protein